MPDDPRDRRKTPSSGVAVTPRTLTPSTEQLAAEVKRLNAMLRRPDLEKRLERVEQVATGDLLRFVRETGARYTEVTIGLARLSSKVEAMAEAMGGWRSDVNERLGDHSDRIAAVEDRSARSHVRLDTLDDQQLDGRVRQLEQHRAGDVRELALTRKQKGGVALLGSGSGAIAWLLSKLFGG